MQSKSDDVDSRAAERLFLAVVNQAVFDVLENGKQAEEAERWLLSKDFDTLDRLFACHTPSRGITTKKRNQRTA